jgi:enoyl-CoA hydratase
MGFVNTIVDSRIALVTLDDPKRRNIVSTELSAELADAVERLEAGGEVKAIVVTGAPPAFSGGGDLADLEAARNGDTGRLHAIYRGFLRVAACALPTVAAVNGPAVGAGMNLALACDIRIAGAAARFDCRFLELALHPGGGHTWMLHRAVGWQTAMAMLAFNQALDGAEAERVGLAWRCVPDAELVEKAMDFAKRASEVPLELIKSAKASLGIAAATPDRLAAAGHEFVAQVWSAGRPEFGDKLAAMKARIGK